MSSSCDDNMPHCQHAIPSFTCVWKNLLNPTENLRECFHVSSLIELGLHSIAEYMCTSPLLAWRIYVYFSFHLSYLTGGLPTMSTLPLEMLLSCGVGLSMRLPNANVRVDCVAPVNTQQDHRCLRTAHYDYKSNPSLSYVEFSNYLLSPQCSPKLQFRVDMDVP